MKNDGKKMKKIIVGLFLSCSLLYTQANAVVRNPPCNWLDVGCVKKQFGVTNYGVWSPTKGSVLFYGNDQTFSFYLFFTQEAINFYKNNSWAGLDLDILFPETEYILPRIDESSVKGPSGTMPIRDTIISDPREKSGTRGIAILNPSAMREGWNIFSFSLKENIYPRLGQNVLVTANIQLTANIADASFADVIMANNSYSWSYYTLVMKWGRVYNDGLIMSRGDDAFRYFSMANAWELTSPSDRFEITSSTDWEGFCWNNVSSDPKEIAKEYAVKCNSRNFVKVIKEIPEGNSTHENTEKYIRSISLNKFIDILKNVIYSVTNGVIDNDDSFNIGPGTSTVSTDPPAPGKLPDFITSKVTMANKSGSKEKYTWKINETAYVHDYIDNIGTADWEGKAKKIKVPFYLSKGSKEDKHSEWVRVDRQEIKKEHLKVKDKPKHEYIKFNLQDWADDGTIMPGRTYNFVVCADRPHDEDNGDGDVKEKHKSNNCSTEAVFYVDYGPARNVDLMADMLALTGGRTELQAGEKYGLQVEVSNIGTEQPWNGFLTSYEIKGPSTGGAWQKIGEDTSKASSLYPGAIHFEAMDGDDEIHAPMVGGDYVFRACTDYTQAVPETDESNNCTEELPVYVVPPPMPDLITEGLQLTHGRTSLIAGELYGLTVNVRNIGDVTPSSYSYTKYEIKGPGTGDAWQFVTEDGTKAEHLEPGMTHWEEISDDFGAHIPTVPGTYTARACADYQGAVPESDEGNNCSETDFEVEDVPAGSPRIVITNPNSDDDWRSDETDHDFRWDYYDFPERGHVRIEYSLDGGATWLLVTDETDNDGRKYWRDMCDYHTVDTHHAFVRITSVEYPYVYDISDEFSIDHAKECE